MGHTGTSDLTTPLLGCVHGDWHGDGQGFGEGAWARGITVHDGPAQQGAWQAAGGLEGVGEELYGELDAAAEAALRARQHRHAASRMRWHWIVWRTLRRPLVLVLSLTMPRVGGPVCVCACLCTWLRLWL